jgi:hypothetical protein
LTPKKVAEQPCSATSDTPQLCGLREHPGGVPRPDGAAQRPDRLQVGARAHDGAADQIAVVGGACEGDDGGYKPRSPTINFRRLSKRSGAKREIG